MTELNNPLNIYTKLKNIQGQGKGLLKENLNKFHGFKFITEYQALIFLKPLLDKEGLSLHFEDLTPEKASDTQPLIHQYKIEKIDREWMVEYWKQATLTNCDKPAEQIKSKFLTLGSNLNIAQAKGCAETYAIKYFLTKFFLIPIADNLDPDNLDKEQVSNKPLTKEEKEKVDDLFKKHGLEEDTKTSTTNKKVSVGNYQPTYRCSICKLILVYKPDSQKYWCAKCNKETAYERK